MMESGTEAFYKTLKQRLAQQAQQNLSRQRYTFGETKGALIKHNGDYLVNFCSNDYLGLANHPELALAFRQGVEKYGIGSSASPLICGRKNIHCQLEEKIASKTGYERALLFPSGYMANLGLITALVTTGDGIFMDRLIHASMIDAALLSKGSLKRYLHVDPNSLQKQLATSGKNSKLVLTEGLFSMGGDIAPLGQLSMVCKQHEAILIVDDAHGFGVLGKFGSGSASLHELSAHEVPVLMGTFSKALGTAGAFVAASETIIEVLIQFARSYIYTTASPPALAFATLVALELLERESWRREHLQSLIERFRQGAEQLNFGGIASATQIQPIIIGDVRDLLDTSKRLFEKGFLITAIRPPTVPAGSARLRITLTASHTEEQVDQLLDALAEVLPNGSE